MPVTEGTGTGEYILTISHVSNGEPAHETVLRRPSIDLENRTDALKTFVNAQEISQNTFNTTHAHTGADGSAALDVPVLLDQDDMLDNDDTKGATQQSIKAYVDAEVAAATPSVDDVSIEIVGGNLQVKDVGITASKIASAVAGEGLTGGAGSALDVLVDDVTIGINGSNQLETLEVVTINSTAEEAALPATLEHKVVISTASHNLTKTYNNCVFIKNSGTFELKITTGTLTNCTIYNDYYVSIDGDCTVKECKFFVNNFRVYSIPTDGNFDRNFIHCQYFRDQANANSYINNSTIKIAESFYQDAGSPSSGTLRFDQCLIESWKFINNNATDSKQTFFNRGTYSFEQYECVSLAAGRLNISYGSLRIGLIQDADTAGRSNLIDSGLDATLTIGKFEVTTSIVEGREHFNGEYNVRYFGGAEELTTPKQQSNVTGSGAWAPTVDWGKGHSAVLDIDAATSVDISFSNAVKGNSYVLKIIQGTNTLDATWDANVKWSGGTAPTLTATDDAVDILSFYYDGTDFYGTFLGDFQ
jgi:hypothetical protein